MASRLASALRSWTVGLLQEPVRKIRHGPVRKADGVAASRAAACLSAAEGPLQSEVSGDCAKSPALPFPLLVCVFFVQATAHAAAANHTDPCWLRCWRWRESLCRAPALVAWPQQRLCHSVPPKHSSSLDFI